MKWIIFFILITQAAGAYDTLRYDLSDRWKVSENGNVMEFKLGAEHSGMLKIQSVYPVSILINNQLVSLAVKSLVWPVDSIIKSYGQSVQVRLVSKFGTRKIVGMLESVTPHQQINKVVNHSSNAIIVVSSILLMILIVFTRVWPQAVLGYYSIAKVLSVRSSEENFITIRVTSLNNLFVYIFTSLLAATNFVTLSYFRQRPTGENDIWVSILIIAFIALTLLAVKIIVLNLLASAYKLTEFAPLQFYNFIRVLLSFFSISLFTQLVIFMSGGNAVGLKPFFNVGLIVVIAVFELSIFAKLVARGGFTVFHLFSYLCASELIPLTILFTVFFPRA